MATASGGWRDLPDRRPIASLALTILACEIVGASGSVFTATGLETWYATLDKPAFNPPNWVFAPVWTTLFALLGVGLWLVWRNERGASFSRVRAAMAAFGVQFGFNLAWSAAFFWAESPFAGLVVIAALWIAIVATIWTFYRVDRRAAAVLVPYLLWVSFAAILNFEIWRLN